MAVKNLPIFHRVAVPWNVCCGLHFDTLLKSSTGFGAIIFTRGASANLRFPACAHISGVLHDRSAELGRAVPNSRPPDDVTTTLTHIKQDYKTLLLSLFTLLKTLYDIYLLMNTVIIVSFQTAAAALHQALRMLRQLRLR